MINLLQGHRRDGVALHERVQEASLSQRYDTNRRSGVKGGEQGIIVISKGSRSHIYLIEGGASVPWFLNYEGNRLSCFGQV